MKGLRVAILGAARSGLACARLMRAAGASVFLSEVRPRRHFNSLQLPRWVDCEFGRHTKRALDADLLIVSPGVPPALPLLKEASRRGIAILSELEAAWRMTRPKKTIAITGTNGKSTTALLTGHLLREAGVPAIVAGNIGTPLSSVVSRIKPETLLVLEVSSYQLHFTKHFSPELAAILNVYPEHLSWHGGFHNYLTDKSRIFAHQNKSRGDICIFNAEDKGSLKCFRQCLSHPFLFSANRPVPRGLFLREGRAFFRDGKKETSWRMELQIPGRHNLENAMAASLLAHLCGVSPKNLEKGLLSFQGVEHRLEEVGFLRGVRYINDSKATHVESTRAAIAATAGPLILILGGRDKGSSYKPLRPGVRDRARRLILYGEAREKIRKDLRRAAEIQSCATLREACLLAKAESVPGETVLFSPACSSFDQFQDFEERGRCFKEYILHGNKTV